MSNSDQLDDEVTREEIGEEIDRYLDDCGDAITAEEVDLVEEVRSMLVGGVYADE